MSAPRPAPSAPPRSERGHGRLLLAAALCALVAGTLASYRPALDADFIGYDDTSYVKTNPHVSHGLRLADVRWALTGYEQSNWHPLTWISHMIDVQLFGLEPRGPHAVNLVLHAINVVALFLLLRGLTGAALPSLLVAALFALHPANVESVAWIAQRKTLLCTFFAILGFAAHARWARGGGRAAYAACLGALVLSLASKPMFVTFPFLLLLLDYWPLRRPQFETGPAGEVSLSGLVRGWARLVPEKAPHLVLCLLVALVTMDAQRDAMSSLEHLPAAQRLANVAIAYVRYLGTFFVPRRLAVFYPLYPESQTLPVESGALALLAVLSAGLCWLGLRRRHLLVGWLWFLGTLVPVIGLVQVGMQSMADRYVYVPYWGLAIAVAWSLHELVALRLPAARAALAASFVLLACWLGALTHRQTEKWHDAIRLFSAALEDTDDNWLAHGVLAERYYALSEFEKAAEQSREAVKFNRNLGTVRSTWGLALHDMGKLDEALEQFELAAQQEPDNPVGFMNLGWFHSERGRYDQALSDLETAASKITRQTIPYNRKTIYANWANALAKTGQLPAAREKYDLALGVDSDNVDFLRDAARVDVRLGDPERAIERLRQVLALAPDDADAAWLLAAATAQRGDASPALFARAQERAPRQVVVAVELARTLAHEGKAQDALRLLDAILALAPPPDAADAGFVGSTLRAHRGEILLEQGDVRGAIGELDRALALWPDNYDANNRLAFLLATSADPALRDPERAVALAERASAARREFASLGTLAAAYAAAGRLPAAVDTAREGLELASQAKDQHAMAALEQQVEIYRRMGAPVGDRTQR